MEGREKSQTKGPEPGGQKEKGHLICPDLIGQQPEY